MKRKIIAIIEQASDGSYSVYTNDKFDQFVPIGFGDTLKEAKNDFLSVFDEMKKELGVDFNVKVIFKLG